MMGVDRLVVIGHSHCLCLTKACADDVRFQVISFWVTPEVFVDSEHGRRLNPAVLKELRAPLLTMMGGGAHTVLSLATHPQPFDFILPDRPELPIESGVELIPYGAVRERLLADTQDYLDLTDQVKGSLRGPGYHVDAPPPVASGEFIRPHVPWDYFPGRLHEIASKWHRWRMWRLNSELVRDHCQRIGVGFIGHPNAAEDEEGFLDTKLSSDGIHGNEAYGNLLAQRIVDVVHHGKLAPGDFHPRDAQ